MSTISSQSATDAEAVAALASERRGEPVIDLTDRPVRRVVVYPSLPETEPEAWS